MDISPDEYFSFSFAIGGFWQRKTKYLGIFFLGICMCVVDPKKKNTNHHRNDRRMKERKLNNNNNTKHIKSN